MHDVVRIADEAVYWVRRPMERAGVANSLAPRILHPAVNGFLYGFARGLGDALELDDARRYELEARMFLAVFAGTPMGEQLGLEALQMAKGMATFRGLDATTREGWQAQGALGREAATRFVALDDAFAPLRATLA